MRLGKVIPGGPLTAGIVFFYLSLLIFLPLGAFGLYAGGMSGESFLRQVTDYRMVHGYLLSFGCALAAAVINGFFGLLLAWVLVRYEFPGKRLMDGLIDLPFALPTAVAGIALTTLYVENGWLGQFFYALGLPSAFSALGITIALVFVGLPFVVRSVQPVLRDLDSSLEEAAAIMGAGKFLTFRRVILPELTGPLISGLPWPLPGASVSMAAWFSLRGMCPLRQRLRRCSS